MLGKSGKLNIILLGILIDIKLGGVGVSETAALSAISNESCVLNTDCLHDGHAGEVAD